MTKKCFKCGTEKPLDEFYVHKMMGDGHLNKCKACTRKDAEERRAFLEENDPGWVEQEKERHRIKAIRYWENGVRPTPEAKKASMDRYKINYPEKYAAKSASRSVPKKPGHERHHWSYNKEHYKDIIYIKKKEHMLAHRHMIYDQERMMYRTTGGELLDTKIRHEEYIKNIISPPF